MVAEQVGADLLVIATDVAGVYVEWATPAARRLRS
jgi:carbamate kinase